MDTWSAAVQTFGTAVENTVKPCVAGMMDSMLVESEQTVLSRVPPAMDTMATSFNTLDIFSCQKRWMSSYSCEIFQSKGAGGSICGVDMVMTVLIVPC